MTDIKNELKRFKELQEKLAHKFHIQSLADYTFAITPKQIDIKLRLKYAASVMALSHGNEVGGAAVINEVLSLIESDLVILTFPVVFSLNNPDAALVDKRFIDEDFNRCYGATETSAASASSIERALIKPIEEMLRHSECNLDIHQTQLPLPIASSFWSILDAGDLVKTVTCIDPLAVIVKTPPTVEEVAKYGMSADNFMLKQGRLGITVELGSRGFDPYQISRGVHLVLSFLVYVRQKSFGLSTAKDFCGKIYQTVGLVQPEPGTRLREDLISFLPIKKGEAFGTKGDGSPLIAEQDCRALFPKIHGKGAFSSKDPLCYLIV